MSDWAGRLIMPEGSQRRADGSVYLEVRSAPPHFANLMGRVVRLRLTPADTRQQALLQAVTTEVKFGDEARKSERQGNWHPRRLDGLSRVAPLESLAGARAGDDVRVRLDAPRLVGDSETGAALEVDEVPSAIEGWERGLVRIEGVAPEGDGAVRIRHFDRRAGRFTGAQETARLVAAPKGYSTETFVRGLLDSPLNADGWFAQVDRDEQGRCTLRALEPRGLRALTADSARWSLEDCLRYLRDEEWRQDEKARGTCQRVLLDPRGLGTSGALLGRPAPPWAETPFREGERYLVLHLFGGVGGNGGDDRNALNIVGGHFALGLARVNQDPLTHAPRFETTYEQVYGNNPEGIVSASSDWSAYMGSLRRGWSFTRPVSDIVVRLPLLDRTHEIGGRRYCFLDALHDQLQRMEARYRTGDRDGAAVIDALTNCSQDSAQALFAAIIDFDEMRGDKTVDAWLACNPHDRRAREFRELGATLDDLRRFVCPLGVAPERWQANAEGHPREPSGGLGRLQDLALTFHTVLPRHQRDGLATLLLRHGAQEWVIHSNSVASEKTPLIPLAPTRLP